MPCVQTSTCTWSISLAESTKQNSQNWPLSWEMSLFIRVDKLRMHFKTIFRSVHYFFTNSNSMNQFDGTQYSCYRLTDCIITIWWFVCGFEVHCCCSHYFTWSIRWGKINIIRLALSSICICISSILVCVFFALRIGSRSTSTSTMYMLHIYASHTCCNKFTTDTSYSKCPEAIFNITEYVDVSGC